MQADKFLFQLEPPGLIDAILEHPPGGFRACDIDVNGRPLPAFTADFDLLLTADESLHRLVGSLLPARLYGWLLRPRTLFVGTTVSEFALFPAAADPVALPGLLKDTMAATGSRFVIVKDIAPPAALLSPAENAAAAELCQTLTAAGFVFIEGQAMAYIPLDFTTLDEFFGRFSASRRSDWRRKRKKRSATRLEIISTGAPLLAEPAVVDQIYRLYENVYNNSDIHFDKLTRPFFAKVLSDGGSGGRLFCYWQDDRLIGYCLGFLQGDLFIDKYRGAEYPAFRDNNLYYVSWFDMLEYALAHNCRAAVFGWTDPEIKAYLGSSFLFTRHAVYTASPLLRRLLARFAGAFESDRKTLENWYAKHGKREVE
jgi:predicted N-acyltransferase